jgi:phospholipase/lecithinase/hemolysin
MRFLVLLSASAVALAAAVSVQAAAKPLVRYVAMGDSYASGTALGDYGTSGACKRSARAYAYRLGAQRGGLLNKLKPNLVACSGATTVAVARDQLSALSKKTDLVTISVGGDDLKFADVVKGCVKGDCKDTINRLAGTAGATLTPRLKALYAAIRKRVRSDTKVVVIGYPRLFPVAPGAEDLGCRNYVYPRIRAGEQFAANHLADVLTGVIGAAARAARFIYVDSIPIYDGHDACRGDQRYVNSYIAKSINDSFHPTQRGHEAWALAIVNALYPPANCARTVRVVTPC